MSWCEQTSEGVLLRLYIQPKASRTEVVGPFGEPPRLKIRVAAPPVDGEANAELLRFIKKTLKVSASRILLVRGETSRSKDVLCKGVSLSQVSALGGTVA